MRRAGNFHPEWGYLAPAPSFLRTARNVIVATAIGATAGAAVVFSLVDRPGSEANLSSASVAARTLARPAAEAAPAGVKNAATGQGIAVSSAAVSAPARPAAQPAQAQPAQNTAPAHKLAVTGNQDRGQDIRKDETVTASDSSAGSTTQPPAAVAALADVAAAKEGSDPSATQVQTAPAAAAAPVAEPAPAADTAPAQKKSAKKHRATPRYASRGDQPNAGMNNFYARPLLPRLFNFGGEEPYGGTFRFSDR